MPHDRFVFPAPINSKKLLTQNTESSTLELSVLLELGKMFKNI